jgi:hypothetical protein
LKKQHVKTLFETFTAKLAEFNEKRAQIAAGVPPQHVSFEINFDLQTLEPLSQPIAPLQDLVFGKLTASAKAIMLTGVLTQSHESLNGALVNRNALIASWRQERPPHDQILRLYFGTAQPGAQDQTYPTLVDAIYSYTDDVICFSKMLGDELAAQGDQARELFDKHFPRDESPIITKVEYPDVTDLMPPPEKFTDFGQMFRPQQRSKKPNRWHRLRNRFLKVFSRT